MIRPALCAVVLGVMATVAACSASSKPPAMNQEPGVDGGTHPGPDGGSSSGGEGGAQGDATSGDAGDAGTDGDDASSGAPVCHTDYTWSATERVASIAAAGFDRFGSVSADELTVVWSDSTGNIFYADRTSTTNGFGAPGQVTPTVQLANDRVAIDPTGLELVATLASGSSFTTMVRQSRGSPWEAGPTVPDPFKNIDSTVSLSGGAVSSPVVSADGSSFFFVVTTGGTVPTPYESVWDAASGMWSLPSELPNPELTATSLAEEKRPTGASADDRTLFFFDEGAGKERAAWRHTSTSPFSQFVDLVALPEAAPSGDCVTLYFRGTDDAGAGLFTGTDP